MYYHITSTLNNESNLEQETQPDEHYGEVRAEVLMFKGIPYQIKLTTSKEEKRQQRCQKFISIKC